MMEGWKKVRLGDFANITMGQSPPSKDYNNEGHGLPFYQGKTEFGEYYPSIAQYSTSGNKKAEKGDILFTVRAPVGELNISNCHCIIGRGLASIRAKENKHQRFLYYLLKVSRTVFESRSYGAVYDAINAKDLKNSELLIPKDESSIEKIASILSAYDDLIENNLKRIKLLEEKAQLTYEEWFVLRKLNGEKIVDSQISIESLSAHIERFINGGWGKEEIEGNYFKEAYVIRGTDMPKVSKGQFDDLPLRYHTESNLKSRLLQHGDIAIEMSNGNIGNVGRSFYFDSGLSKVLSKPTICASFCKMIRPKALNLSYLIDAHLKYIYNTDKMLVYKAQAANGINNFNFDEMIKDEELYIPKGEKLDVLTDSIKVNYDAISNIRIQNQRLKEARDILLPRLMTGMIDVEKMKLENLQSTTA